MSRRGSDTLQLLNSAVALVLLIPILLLVVSAVHERARVPSADRGRPHDQPPIIVLSESQGYSFPSGRADLSPAFQTRLRTDIIPKLKRTIADYQCDVVEVVGHTDSQPVASRSTTDADLLAFVGGQKLSVSPGSNADLGLLRAWSVIRFLRENAVLEPVLFHGLSAGQLISPSGHIAEANAPVIDADRRRIEIRVRRSPGQ